MKTNNKPFCRLCFDSHYSGYHFCYALPAVIDSGKYDEKENVDVNEDLGRAL